MTSIKNDAFVIGTAAVSAGAANLAAQNSAAIKAAANKVTKPAVDAFAKATSAVKDKETYTSMAEGLKKTVENASNAIKNLFRKDPERIIASSISKKAHELRKAQLKEAFGPTLKESAKKGLGDLKKNIEAAFGSIKEGLKGFGKKVGNKETYTNTAEGIKNGAKKFVSNIAESKFIKGTNWKTVGKYAGAAAAVALAVVVAKNIFNRITNKD